MLPFIKKLTELYKQKRRILKNLQELIEPIEEILKDPSLGYTDEERQMLQTHIPFHKGTGLISVLNELVKVNVELRHYKDEEDTTSIRDEHVINMEMNLANLGEDVLNAYRKMMELVGQENRILINFLKPAIGEILQRQDWHEWIGHLRHFNNFIVILKENIGLFKELLEKLLEKGYLDELKSKKEPEVLVKIGKKFPKYPDNAVSTLTKKNLTSLIELYNILSNLWSHSFFLQSKIEEYSRNLETFGRDHTVTRLDFDSIFKEISELRIDCRFLQDSVIILKREMGLFFGYGEASDLKKELPKEIRAEYSSLIDNLNKCWSIFIELTQELTTRNRYIVIPRIKEIAEELYKLSFEVANLLVFLINYFIERRPSTSQTPAYNLEAIGFRILDEIYDNRRHPLASLSNLQLWLQQNYPGVKPIPLLALNVDLWTLIILTTDGKTGIVVPALDSIIGPGEILRWCEGGRYDGTQALVRANIVKLAKAEYREDRYVKGEYTWICIEKGIIDLTRTQTQISSLPEELRTKLEQSKQNLDEYLRIVNSIYQELPTGTVREVWKKLINNLNGDFEQIKQALLGYIISAEHIKSITLSFERKGSSSFRDYTVSLLTALISGDASILTSRTYEGLGVEFLNRNATVKALVDELLKISNMKIILPRTGDVINNQTMEHGLPWIRMERRGYLVVHHLIRPGYFWANTVYTKAQVVAMD